MYIDKDGKKGYFDDKEMVKKIKRPQSALRLPGIGIEKGIKTQPMKYIEL